MRLKSIAEGKDYDEEIEKIDSATRKDMKIKNFYGKESEEIKYEKEFDDNCIILSSYVNQPIKTLTVKEYFNLRKYVGKKASTKSRNK